MFQIRRFFAPLTSGQLRDKLEQQFSRWGDFSYRHAWWIILFMSMVVAVFAWYARDVHLDTSTESFLDEQHPARVTYREFRHQFGRDEKMVISLAPKEIFSLSFLNALKQLHEELEAAPHVREVNSLINARQTYGDGDQLIVGELLEEWPETQADLDRLKRRVMDNPLYQGMLISEDGNKTTIAISTETYTSSDSNLDNAMAGFDDAAEDSSESTDDNEPPQFLTGEENSEFVQAIDQIILRYQSPELEIHVGGSPSMAHKLMKVMADDMVKFTGLSIACIAFFLALLFRRVSTIILPLAVALLSLICTLGEMSLLGIAFTPIGQSMPSFLLAVAVGNSVHLLAIFFQAIHRGLDKRHALSYSLGHSGLPVVMTGLTTAGGILSFTTAEISHVADFGLITTIGVINALMFSLLLLPALIAVFPVKLNIVSDEHSEKHALSRAILLWCGEFATTHAGKVVLVYALAITAALISASNIRFSHDPVRWFKPSDPLLVATEYLDEHFAGAMFLEIILDTHQEDGVKDPDFLRRIETMQRAIADIEVGPVRAGKSFSLVDINKEIHKALNNNDPAYYTIPDDRALVAQELLLFENSGADDLQDFVDPQFSKARVSVVVPARDAIVYKPYLDTLRVRIETIMGDAADVTFSGIMTLVIGTIGALIESLASTYLLAFLIITPLMMLLIGSVRVGLISMIPNLTPIVFTLGIMGWRGFPMDAFTLLTGSIALGLAVDDTIHFMHNFRRYYQQCGDTREAVRKTLSTTGQALFITSAVLASGFFIYMFSSMVNLINFGLLTGFTIIMALLADIILAPALMVVLERFMKSTYQDQTDHIPTLEEVERRSATRTSLQQISAVIRIDGAAYHCKLIDVTAGIRSEGIGVQLSRNVDLFAGKIIEIESSVTGNVKGKIVWTDKNRFGLKIAA